MRAMPVYLIHLERPLNESSISPFGKAQHYAGFAKRDIDARFAEHRSGSGAAILKAAMQAGIDFQIVKRWEGEDRKFERWLKRGSLTPYCPLCRAEYLRLKRMRQAQRRHAAKQGGELMK